MVQIVCTLLLFIVIIFPIGNYVYHISSGERTFADPVFDKMDNCMFKVLKIDTSTMTWKKYVVSLLMVNLCLVFIGYLILRIQSIEFLNPNGMSGMEESLSFNTIISFMTNTNLQHYAGESGLSYFSQMFVIIMMMFTSAATGFSACVAMVRGLLVPQNLNSNIQLTTIEGKFQEIASGPIAALESIKHLGTNGGGFLGANSATPLENPTILSNMIELFSMMILPISSIIVFGRMAYGKYEESKANKVVYTLSTNKPKKIWMGKEGRTVFVAMSILFVIGLGICFYSESQGNHAVAQAGITETLGNMEGKEVRFGVAQSALFTTATTSFTTGSINNMHDTLTPLGGLVPLLHMMLNVVFGGAGVGLMNMLIYAIIAVFICGLMIGRTPEYLGKKIEGKEMKLAALCIIIHPLLILGFTALALSIPEGINGITNPSFHGLSQVLYEFASSAANNGSGFEGLADNSLFWNMSCGIVMFLARYLPMIIQLGIAGSLMNKIDVNKSTGILETNTISFAIILVVVVYIFSALTFLPAIALGPIAEWLTL